MPVASRNLIVLVLLLCLGAGVYLWAAAENGELVNAKVSRTDQGAYIAYGIKLRDSDFSFIGGRNRMPLYPALLASFMDKGTTKEAFFATGKRINTWLSLFGLIGVGMVFFRHFPRHHALNLLGLTAFGVFVFKAPYVQAEILYYLLTFAVFLLCWRLFQFPRWGTAVWAGGLLGLAHLTKASVTPGLLVMLVFFPLDALWQKFRTGGRDTLYRFLVVATMAAAFLAVISPYLMKSKEIYGQYFYNVNSTFYIWCESWEDVVNGVKAAGDRRGWPEMPPDEIPSLQNYVRNHTTGEMLDRVFTGISRVFHTMARSHGFLWFFVAYLVYAVALAWHKRRVLIRLFLQRPIPGLALAAYFFGYGFLIAWYSQIIQGNRFILALFLPFLFSLSVFALRFSRRVSVPVRGGQSLSVLTGFNVVISIWLLIDILITCVFRIGTVYGGS